MSTRPSPSPAPSPRPSPSILRRSGDVSTADKKPEETQELPRTPKVFKQMLMKLQSLNNMFLKAADVAKVPEPMKEEHQSGKTPFCVDNQLIESKQE